MGPAILTIRDAQAILGLHGPSDGPTLTRAFRAAVKAARPDRPEGDAERFRRVIEAYRLIQQAGGIVPALAAPLKRAPARPVATLGALTALNGGAVEIFAPGGKRLKLTVPAGLRSGDHLRLKGAGAGGEDLFAAVRISGDDALRCLGDDLYMDCAVDPRTLADGGRIEINTHAGARSAWLTPGAPPRLRLKGLGLPARASRPQGHLFVDLKPAAETPSAAEDLLLRFSRVWTPQRLAA